MHRRDLYAGALAWPLVALGGLFLGSGPMSEWDMSVASSIAFLIGVVIVAFLVGVLLWRPLAAKLIVGQDSRSLLNESLRATVLGIGLGAALAVPAALLSRNFAWPASMAPIISMVVAAGIASLGASLLARFFRRQARAPRNGKA
ncbi:MFS family permease [Microbacterium resistens]|uniref:MFS family permease n=1 Tax=Microbacterium resistens TaxID=156977 RepID=A0ABU1SBB1_9MICO|nr:hypothetical protein [Microbacterium resistens]MDR6866907.1 MFS family permease [Microbacterium resistens]